MVWPKRWLAEIAEGVGEATGRVSICFDCGWKVRVAERKDDKSITEGRRQSEAEACGPI